jgi:hypothetical protein
LPLTGRAAVNYPQNTAEDQALIEEEDHDALKELSQHTFMNAFYTVMFGAHNTTGIHGACAIDILHHLFGPVSTCSGLFFIQVGATSASKDELDALARGMVVFARQRPKHAEEQVQRWYHWWQTDGQGVRRCFAFTRYYCVRSSAGRKILQDTNLGNFNDDQIADWLLLLETLLGWVQWLKSEKMQVKHVDASSGNIDISCSWSKGYP